MPYKVLKQEGKFIVKNEETGEIKGIHKSAKKAMRQMRLLYAVEGGRKIFTGKKEPFKVRKLFR